MIPRKIESIIHQKLFQGKAIVLIGPRQSGKTTLLRNLFSGFSDIRWMNGDDPETGILLDGVTTNRWKQLVAGKKIFILDEAQRIPDIGLKLKLLVDEFPEVQVVASGSSAFELSSQVNEPLTGRKWEYTLLPLSHLERVEHFGWLEERQNLSQRLIYGSYPEVVTYQGDPKEVLRLLADSYLYKDILSWERIKKPEKLTRLLQALAFQLGNEVSFHELGQLVGLDNQTVESYIHILEQAYIIFRLPPLSRNLRNEIKNKRKIYFYDNGIRNAIIAQYQPIELRQDVGALWENFLISERKKYLHYASIAANSFFWRTNSQQEIDYVEERDGKFFAYEIKWNAKSKIHFPITFTQAYPQHETRFLNKDNFEDFLGG
ncbi:MAG: ATP-binding protein [Bacteroidia bacterium]|nr:ATP-binding protein [Bacteroidia bacterium]